MRPLTNSAAIFFLFIQRANIKYFTATSADEQSGLLSFEEATFEFSSLPK